jgi:hypothetical protein
MLVEGNPLTPQGDFFACFRNPAVWRPHTLSALDHPNVVLGRMGKPVPFPGAVTHKWVEERRADWGEAHPLWSARVLAEFPEEGDNVLISLATLDRAAKGERPHDALDDGLHMGVDVARFGADDNVLVVRNGYELVAEERWHGVETMSTAGRILRAMKRYKVKPEHTHIDVIGVGAGVVDRLIESGRAVDGVNFACEPLGDWCEDKAVTDVTFKNRRAELWWVASRMLRKARVQVPEKYGALWADLSAPMYDYDSAGRIVIEPKDKIKVRLGRSPDAGDAYVLSFSHAGSGSLITVL